jgi:HPt (histidine-containing phosphotransfer) domain-containing protein
MEEMKINFLKQNGVDVDKGIENTMDFETYNELLIDFCNTFVEEVNKFNAFKIAGDMFNYEIIVHALKSNCRTLGFSYMGEMFYQHELASKQNDINYVNEHYNELINEVNRVYAILTQYKAMV